MLKSLKPIRLVITLTVILFLGLYCNGQGRVTPNRSSSSGKSGSLVSFPSTYKITQTFNDDRSPKVTFYFIFKSADEVIWCVESSDGYLFAVAYGVYNKSSQQVVFSKDRVYSSFYALNGGDIKCSLKKQNGALQMSGLVKGRYLPLTKCADIQTSSSLSGTSWTGYYDDEELNLFFQSDSEVILNGKPHCYIQIGNKVGFLSDDNPEKEAMVGYVIGEKLMLHRSGTRINLDYPWIECYKE